MINASHLRCQIAQQPVFPAVQSSPPQWTPLRLSRSPLQVHPPAPAHTHVSCLLWHNLAVCCCLQLIQEVTSEKKMGLPWREGQLEHRGRNWNTRQKKPVPFMHRGRKKNKSGAGAGNLEEWWQETWQGSPGLREQGMGLMPEESQKCISSAEQGWARKPPQTSFLLTVLIVEFCDTWDDY